jgi:hypothetical protein
MWRGALLLAATPLLVQACALLPKNDVPRRMPVNSYLADARDLMAVRRVVVLPVAGEHVPETLRKHLQRSMEAAIASTQRFQVVPLPAVLDEDRHLLESELSGRLSTSGLVDLANAIKSMVWCSVGSTPSSPTSRRLWACSPSSSRSTRATTVWAVDATYDAGREDVRLDLREFCENELAQIESLHGWDLLRLSPRLYGEYVVHRVVATLRPGR